MFAIKKKRLFKNVVILKRSTGHILQLRYYDNDDSMKGNEVVKNGLQKAIGG